MYVDAGEGFAFAHNACDRCHHISLGALRMVRTRPDAIVVGLLIEAALT
jgi:hypothetical protein